MVLVQGCGDGFKLKINQNMAQNLKTWFLVGNVELSNINNCSVGTTKQILCVNITYGVVVQWYKFHIDSAY